MKKVTLCAFAIGTVMTGNAVADYCYIDAISNVSLGTIDVRNIGGNTVGDGTIKLRCYFRTNTGNTHYCITDRDGIVIKYMRNNRENDIPFSIEDDIAGTVRHSSSGQREVYVDVPFRITLHKPQQNRLMAGEYKGWFGYRMHSIYGMSKSPAKELLCNDAPVPGSSIGKMNQTFVPDQFVTANIENPCSIEVDGIMDFGIMPISDQVHKASSTVRVSCAKMTQYEIGISHGNGDDPTMRSMKCQTNRTCGGSEVRYGLYQDASGNQKWTDEWGSRNVVNASDMKGMFTVYGRLFPSTATRPGTYSDQVVVEVRWLDR